MFKRGFTLVEIMIVVAIIALLAALAIPNLLRARVTANESAAQSTLRVISTALETYAAANNSKYPSSESDLTAATPPYLNKAYCGQIENGYSFGCTLTINDYTVTARPLNCRTSGTKSFTVTTGGVLATDPTCTAAEG